MASPNHFSPSARLYIGGVIVAGLGVIVLSGAQLMSQPPSPHWLILAALTLLTGTFTVKVPAVSARISVSEAFVFTSVLMFGPATATVIVALDCVVMSFWLDVANRSAVRTLFNVSSVSLAIWVASNLFYALTGTSPETIAALTLAELAWPLLALAGLYFILNSGLVAIALASQRRQNVVSFWIHNFPWLSLNYFGGASVAALLVAYTRSIDLGALGIILPLLVISYLTYRTSLGRVEDAKRHVEQMNALYMSTIETLAMAVDAKDQITHGHIRRVQVYATELACRLGVTDEQQISAIQAAALLHDMGKLAIPEHILNKPGKLTPGEFEKMKRHADIGADLLSSIPFPYPVVPIVRHHHENWDGTGYPSRIAGTDIPLGARILSVVDCFDALTSDRPYRPRLTAEAAFDILKERRGTMYDPLVIDTFISAYEAIAPIAITAGQQAKSLVPGSPGGTPQDVSRVITGIHVESHEATVLMEARRLIARCHRVEEGLASISRYLRQLVPGTVAALYVYEPGTDTLRCVTSIGDTDGLLSVFEVPNGERTSGWVAANKAHVLNSDASLDLGQTCDAFSPRLRSALSVPVLRDNACLGVFSIYSTLENPFTERHVYVAEQLGRSLGEHLQDPTRLQGSVVRFSDSRTTSQVRK